MAIALVPVKRLDRAKTRLAGSLDAATRGELMQALVADVVGVLLGAPSIDRVLVATSDPRVPRLASALGAATVSDGDLPWNEGLAYAIARVRPVPDVLAIVAADLPLLERDDVEQLLAAVPPRGVAVGRAHDAGSNALALRPPDALVPNFGLPGSAALHVERARAAGLGAAVVDCPGLALDLDTPADVERCLAAGGGGRAIDLLRAALDGVTTSARSASR